MKIVKTIQEVRACVKSWRTEGLTVGFVPTMGCLHEGHRSLIRQAAEENDHVVVSIFINPLQFGKKEDLDTYPRDLKKDSEVCTAAGADLIFHPAPDEMYGSNFSAFVDVNGLTESLCGKSPPGRGKEDCGGNQNVR